MPKASVHLDIALEAISTDLDVMGEEIANIAGNQAQAEATALGIREEVRGVQQTLDVFLDLLRREILPAVQEIPKLRQRIVYLENPSLQRPEGLDAE